MKYKLFSSILLFMILQGCTSNAGRWYNVYYAPIYLYGNIKSYELDVKSTVYVGQEIIKVRAIAQKSDGPQEIKIDDKIYAEATYEKFAPFKNKLVKVTLEAGPKIYKVSNMVYFDDEDNACTSKSGKMFYLLHASDIDYPWGILLSKDGVVNDTSLYDYSYKMRWIPPTLVVKPNVTKITVKSAKPLNQDYISCESYELIYTGRNDVQMNITYREFTASDLAKPSFYQNLSYEANAKQIRFKDFIIQIHEATNEKLVYTVVKDGLPKN